MAKIMRESFELIRSEPRVVIKNGVVGRSRGPPGVPLLASSADNVNSQRTRWHHLTRLVSIDFLDLESTYAIVNKNRRDWAPAS